MSTTTLLNKNTQRKKNLSITQLQKLDKLAREIRSSYDSAGKLAKSARERSREALAEAMLCGKALNEAKGMVGHGGWLKWIAAHCKGVSHDTATRYMHLANSAHVRNLKDPNSLRQAYIAIGILDDSDAETIKTTPVSVPETTPQPVAGAPAADTAPEPTSTTNAVAECDAKVMLKPLLVVTGQAEQMVAPIEHTPKTTPDQLLSQLRQATTDLIIQLNNNIRAGGIAPSMAKAATLEPLTAFFATLPL